MDERAEPLSDRPNDAAADRLGRAFLDLYPTPAVPPVIDARILHDAAAHLGRDAKRGRRGRLGWVGPAVASVAAVAACVLIGLRLIPRGSPLAVVPGTGATSPGTVATAPALRGDIDGNGKVDILDAFAVARGIRSGQPLPKAWDVNGDGVVDQRDVDWLAARAVQVEPGLADADRDRLGSIAAGLESLRQPRTARAAANFGPSRRVISRSSDGVGRLSEAQ